MIIKKIELENIRSHQKSEIEFDKGVTVFTGRTGCGKSTILMALEYALFGTEGGVSNNAILRRGVENGRVIVELEEGGDSYRIIRGLKRQKKNIGVDISNMAILKNHVPLPLLGRVTDINRKVLEIINYPEDIKPKDLFETTSYTRQDEIRALIQMSPEKRQEHIDKILQLSKYKDTWENMKDVVSFFSSELSDKRVRLEQFENLQEDALKLEKKIIETEAVFEDNNKQVFSKKQEYREIKKKVEELESEIKDMIEKRRKVDQIKGIIENMQNEIRSAERVMIAFNERISEMENNIKKIGETKDFDSLQIKNIELLKEIEIKQKEFEKIKKDFEKIKTLGEGECPVCMQTVTSEHIINLNEEFMKMKTGIENEITELRKEQLKLEPEMRNSRLASELKRDLEINVEKQKVKREEKERKENELKNRMQELDSLEIDEEGLKTKEGILNEFKEKEKELFSSMQSIESVNRTLGEQLEYLKLEFNKKRDQLNELERSKDSIQKLEKAIDTLNRLRDDIRNIREIIRKNFLEDFRQEFQKKFEEIRKYEEDYSVDIKSDYEPVAFDSNGEEVPISNLSGGEKTSVALSYRLALADLAAQISAINPSEILILDEPTTGFDQEDVKALPAALRNIKTIPQIIIVTHEEELKNAADHKFEVKKESSISNIWRATNGSDNSGA